MKKKVNVKKHATPIRWFHEEHHLPGRTVTIAEVLVPIGEERMRGYRGVSIRNPKDSPIPSDGIKFALTRAMKRAKLPKAKRKQVWQDFLIRWPQPGQKVR